MARGTFSDVEAIFSCILTLSVLQIKTATFGNSADLDETNEPSHQDLYRLPFYFFLLVLLIAIVDMSNFKLDFVFLQKHRCLPPFWRHIVLYIQRTFLLTNEIPREITQNV